MTYDIDAAGSSGLTAGLFSGDLSRFDRTDRILLGSCAGVWLTALGTGVAAGVALTNLAGGGQGAAGDDGTPWGLYGVIGVSAAVIAGAVPLLLRARREAQEQADDDRSAPPATRAARAGEAPTERLREPSVGRFDRSGYAATMMPGRPLPAAVVDAIDRVWLRHALVIIGAVGLAMALIGLATYFMAVDSNTVATVLLVLAGLITVAMPAATWFYLRELRELVDPDGYST